MPYDDPPLSMVALNVRVNLRNSCEIGSERRGDSAERV
jgi:hypothetical protein